MSTFALRHRQILSLARLCCLIIFVASVALLPQSAGAWPRDTTVNILDACQRYRPPVLVDGQVYSG